MFAWKLKKQPDFNELRGKQESECGSLCFRNVTIHGDADFNEDLPDSFTVTLTPSTVARLKKTLKALKKGSDIAGLRVRDYDVTSSLEGHKVKDPRIIMYESEKGYVTYELQCFCCNSLCCFISEMTVKSSQLPV